MKKIIFSLFLLGAIAENAQDINNPWARDIGLKSVDFHPTNGDITYGYGGWFDEYFNTGDY